MNFIVDAQLPPLLAARLTEVGHPSVHAGAIGPLDATDRQLWAAALDRNCAIITKDSDFFRMGDTNTRIVQVLWLRVGNCGNAQLLTIVLANIEAAATAFAAGEMRVEIR